MSLGEIILRNHQMKMQQSAMKQAQIAQVFQQINAGIQYAKKMKEEEKRRKEDLSVKSAFALASQGGDIPDAMPGVPPETVKVLQALSAQSKRAREDAQTWEKTKLGLEKEMRLDVERTRGAWDLAGVEARGEQDRLTQAAKPPTVAGTESTKGKEYMDWARMTLAAQGKPESPDIVNALAMKRWMGEAALDRKLEEARIKATEANAPGSAEREEERRRAAERVAELEKLKNQNRTELEGLRQTNRILTVERIADLKASDPLRALGLIVRSADLFLNPEVASKVREEATAIFQKSDRQAAGTQIDTVLKEAWKKAKLDGDESGAAEIERIAKELR